MVFKPFIPNAESATPVAAETASAIGGEKALRSPNGYLLPPGMTEEDLPHFMREDRPEKPPEAWTAPFGWRP